MKDYVNMKYPRRTSWVERNGANIRLGMLVLVVAVIGSMVGV